MNQGWNPLRGVVFVGDYLTEWAKAFCESEAMCSLESAVLSESHRELLALILVRQEAADHGNRLVPYQVEGRLDREVHD
jgi:hypothetical protein